MRQRDNEIIPNESNYSPDYHKTINEKQCDRQPLNCRLLTQEGNKKNEAGLKTFVSAQPNKGIVVISERKNSCN